MAQDEEIVSRTRTLSVRPSYTYKALVLSEADYAEILECRWRIDKGLACVVSGFGGLCTSAAYWGMIPWTLPEAEKDPSHYQTITAKSEKMAKQEP